MSKAILIAVVALMTVVAGRELSKGVTNRAKVVTSTLDKAASSDTQWIEKSRKGF